jgi:hypothetical protein
VAAGGGGGGGGGDLSEDDDDEMSDASEEEGGLDLAELAAAGMLRAVPAAPCCACSPPSSELTAYLCRSRACMLPEFEQAYNPRPADCCCLCRCNAAQHRGRGDGDWL